MSTSINLKNIKNIFARVCDQKQVEDNEEKPSEKQIEKPAVNK